jgi:hypothetical protein
MRRPEKVGADAAALITLYLTQGRRHRTSGSIALLLRTAGVRRYEHLIHRPRLGAFPSWWAPPIGSTLPDRHVHSSHHAAGVGCHRPLRLGGFRPWPTRFEVLR